MSPSSESARGDGNDPASPFAATAAGVRVRVRLSPGARRDAVAGVIADADGRPLLKVTVAAPPVDGRANAALLRLLARHWRLPLRSLGIIAGAADRTKTVLVSGDPEPLLSRLAAAAGGGGHRRPSGR